MGCERDLAVALAHYQNALGQRAGAVVETLCVRMHGLELSVEVHVRGQRPVFVVGDIATVATVRGLLEEAAGAVGRVARSDYEGGDVGLGCGKQLNSDMTSGGSAAMFGEISNEVTLEEEAGHLQDPLALDVVLDVLKRVKRIE